MCVLFADGPPLKFLFLNMPVSADAFAGGAIALLRALADDKKARNGLRWLMAAAYKAGYEPRVGNISLYKLQPSTTSSSPAVEPEEPCTQATGRKRRRLLKSHNEVMTESIDPHSLNDFKDTIRSMENKGYGPKSFLTFVAFLKSIEGKLVIPRHTTNINGCRGLVGADGKCSKCTLDNLTPEWAFQMRLCLTDLKDPSSHLELFGYGALAKFFFGLTISIWSIGIIKVFKSVFVTVYLIFD